MRNLAGTIAQLRPRSPIWWVLTGYSGGYALVALGVLRRMEIEADRTAVRAAGRAATVLALRDSPWLADAWEWYVDSYADWVRTRARHPVMPGGARQGRPGRLWSYRQYIRSR
jgi:Zn-dependent protease with chaperone function